VVVIEDDPTTGAGDASETIPPGSESSPRRSPQRKYSDYFPLAGTEERAFVADISGRVGEEQHVEPSEGAPEVPPPSTASPRRESPARDPTSEPSHEEEPASTEAPGTSAGGPTPTTNVDGGGEPTAPEPNTGKPTCRKNSSCFFSFVFLNFFLKLFCFASRVGRFLRGRAHEH
jgi:hypothetical protein